LPHSTIEGPGITLPKSVSSAVMRAEAAAEQRG
jgi:hypothetical protein